MNAHDFPAGDRLGALDMARRDLMMRREELAHATRVQAQAERNVELATAKLRAALGTTQAQMVSAESVIQPH